MLSARSDVQHPSGHGAQLDASISRPDADAECGVRRTSSHGEQESRGSHGLLSLRLHLVLLFALAAVVPALVVLAFDVAGVSASLPRLPIVGDVLVLLVVASAAGFGVMLGLLVTYALVGPLSMLTRAINSLGTDAVSASLRSRRFARSHAWLKRSRHCAAGWSRERRRWTTWESCAISHDSGRTTSTAPWPLATRMTASGIGT